MGETLGTNTPVPRGASLQVQGFTVKRDVENRTLMILCISALAKSVSQPKAFQFTKAT